MNTPNLQIHTFQLKIHDCPCSPDVTCMLSSPPPTPTSDMKISAKTSIRATSRKEFIRDYARMAPYLRPQRSPLLGKRPDLVPIQWELGRSRAKHSLVQCTTITIRTANRYRGNSDKVTHRNSYDSTSNTSNTSSSTSSTSSNSNGSGDDSGGAPTTIPTLTPTINTSAATRDMLHENIAAPNLAATNKKNDEVPVMIAGSRRPSSGREVHIKGLILANPFETLDLDSSDAVFFPPDWIPRSDHLDKVKVDFSWKGHPLTPNPNQSYFDRLHPQEIKIVCHMRMTPAIYLRCKRVIITAAREFALNNLDFRKSDAQKVCRIDVNKSSRLWAVFDAYGWLKAHRP